jgi:hypothetical protein
MKAESLPVPAQKPTNKHDTQQESSRSKKVSRMKKLSILVPAIAAGILVSGLVVAAPQTHTAKVTASHAPDRAAAFLIASAD